MSPKIRPYLVDAGLSGSPAVLDDLRSFHPFETRDAAFIARLRDLDARAFVDRDLVAPAWVFYDCGLVPGAVLGFLDDSGSVPDPMSLLVALPTARRGVHLIHTLETAPEQPDDALWIATWELATKLLPMSGALFTEAWFTPNSRRIGALGPARVLTAWTPCHDRPSTATLGLDSQLTRHSVTPNLFVDTLAAFQNVQAHIDNGWSCWYLGERADGAIALHLADNSPSSLQDHAFHGGADR